MIMVYGIPNCESVKKSRDWLLEQGLPYQFHDFKKQGMPEAALDAWLRTLGWEAVINRKGTTWRKLEAAIQAGVVDASSARALALAQPSVIKRPVVQWADGAVTVGFSAERFAARLP
jgi:Spx/MgsR family transcriptional regulator